MQSYTGMPSALAFSYGRTGLLALIEVMGWRGKEIILPAYTCAVIPDIILASGNRPRFVDIETNDFNMSYGNVANALGSDTAAVLATHMYGFPMDMAPLKSRLEDSGIMLIHDCALAMGTQYRGEPVWSTGEASIFSFSIGKHLSSVEGGILTVSDKNLGHEIETWRNHNYPRQSKGTMFSKSILFFASWLGLNATVYPLIHFLDSSTPLLKSLTEHFRTTELKLPDDLRCRLADPFGAIGANQMGNLLNILHKKRVLAQLYYKALKKTPGIVLPTPLEGASWSHVPCLPEDRSGFISFMKARGIHVGTELFDYVVPDFPLYKDYADDNFTNARKAAAHIALIPNAHNLNNGQIEHITSSLHEYVG